MIFEDFVNQWKNKPATAWHLELLQRLAKLLRDASECMGAIVVGSFAKGTADRVSDIDLVVFCTEGGATSLLQKIRDQVDPSEIFCEFEGSHGPDSPYQDLILYNFTAFEFHIISPGTKFTLKQPYVEIVNRHDCLSARASEKAPPTRSDLVPYRNGDKWLAWELFNCIKWLSRGEVDTTHEYLLKLAKAIEATRKSDGQPLG